MFYIYLYGFQFGHSGFGGIFGTFIEVKDFCATSAPFHGENSTVTSTPDPTTTSTVVMESVNQQLNFSFLKFYWVMD